jgi:hypothetical protein
MSRRHLQWVTAGGVDETGEGTWYVLTTGELWRTATEDPPPAFDSRPLRNWARAKLRRTPPLIDVLNAALVQLELTADDIEGVFDGASNRAFVPTVRIDYAWASDTDLALSTWTGSRVLMTDRETRVPGWGILATLSWRLPDYWWPNQLEWPKAEMYELQKQIAFIVEDAWMERQLHLQRLAREAVVDELQANVMRERVLALEAVLEPWLPRPLEEL